ncbi:MAG: acyl-CoA dehydrogenase [Candidatus Binatia bacterium]|nr:MAG: acyl-CoA dehydrogenase [Candidatus Binatia bacterium]
MSEIATNEESRVRGLVDVEKLARWMDERKLPGAGEPLEVRFISGGASNEIFELKRGPHRMVLRRPPRKVPEGRNESMLREYRVLYALNDTDVPHARALAACEDTDVLGACFYIMEYVDGWTPMGPLPPPFDRDLEAKRGLGWELVDALAKLARVDWKKVGLEGFGKPEGFLERQVDRWLSHLSRVKFREIPGLDEAAEWLRRHTPRHYPVGIIHGDYQFANVMFHHGAPARMAAIVDWEMSTIGAPLLDLGWVLMGWVNPGEENAMKGYFDYTGMPTREELMQRYAEKSGLSVDNIDYYVVLARFKIACVLEAGYARYVQGGADNPKMAAFGDVVLQMARRAAELARSSKLPPTS